jgi:hypothetical protein
MLLGLIKFLQKLMIMCTQLICLLILGLVPPLTRSRARHLNIHVHSTLVNYVSELTLGAIDVLMIRNIEKDQQRLGKGQGAEEEEQWRPQQEGHQVRLGCDSISGSMTSLYKNGRP